MDVRLAVLADAASVDRGGKLSIFGIFDRVSVGGFPSAHFGAHLVVVLSFGTDEVGKHSIEIVFVDEDGQGEFRLELAGEVGPPVDPLQPQTLRVMLTLPPIPLMHSGAHTFDVFVDGRYAVSVPLLVDDIE